MDRARGEKEGALERCLLRLLEARLAEARREDGQHQLEAALAALGAAASDRHAPDESLDRLLGSPSTRLASYGSLRPGARHHDVVSHLAGEWVTGITTGFLDTAGEYPELEWAPGGPPVAVAVLESSELPAHWQEIDAFEGSGYVRSYVPVELSTGRRVVCSCYLAAS